MKKRKWWNGKESKAPKYDQDAIMAKVKENREQALADHLAAQQEDIEFQKRDLQLEKKKVEISKLKDKKLTPKSAS